MWLCVSRRGEARSFSSVVRWDVQLPDDCTDISLSTHTDTSPQFTSQPGNVTIAAGATTTLECSATGSPTPTITWYKNGLLLSTPTSGSLGITNVQSSDVGRYYCVASNTAGSIQSKTATLRLACKSVTVGLSSCVCTSMVCLDVRIMETERS